MDGILGLKQATADPFVGTVFGSRNVGTSFRVIGNGAPVAQSVPDGGPTPSSRTVELTPPSPGYYLIEISSGRFVDDMQTWVMPSGAFTLSVSR